MDKRIKKASFNEINEIMDIYKHARKFMKENGNPNQWKDSYPEQKLIEDDIKKGNFYECIMDDEIAAVFYYAEEDDASYKVIKDGKWKDDRDYAVVHRVASKKGCKGAAGFCLEWAFSNSGNIKIDTHIDNKPMQGLLKKHGFEYCGKIYLKDGSERIAFQKIKQ